MNPTNDLTIIGSISLLRDRLLCCYFWKVEDYHHYRIAHDPICNLYISWMPSVCWSQLFYVLRFITHGRTEMNTALPFIPILNANPRNSYPGSTRMICLNILVLATHPVILKCNSPFPIIFKRMLSHFQS